MRLPTLISLRNEPLLEKWARLFRYAKADALIAGKIKSNKKFTLIDFGCGQDILYYKYLITIFPSLKRRLMYFGIDPLVESKLNKNLSNIKLIKNKFEKAEIETKADVVTMFALLEHVDDPIRLVKKATKFLKPDGILITTTPSPLARYPLEASCLVGIIAKREIQEHKRYPTRSFLLDLKKELPNFNISHEYFEFGLNNFCIISNKTLPHQQPYSPSNELGLIVNIIRRAHLTI